MHRDDLSKEFNLQTLKQLVTGLVETELYSEAKDIHNRFYSSNPSLDADNNFTADTPELGKLYLSIESDRSLFIEVAAVDGDNVIGTEISLSSSTDSN